MRQACIVRFAGTRAAAEQASLFPYGQLSFVARTDHGQQSFSSKTSCENPAKVQQLLLGRSAENEFNGILRHLRRFLKRSRYCRQGRG